MSTEELRAELLRRVDGTSDTVEHLLLEHPVAVGQVFASNTAGRSTAEAECAASLRPLG